MRVVHGLVIAFLAAGSLVACASPAADSSNGWLVGDWALCEDPDESPKDTLRFNENGTGSVLRSAGGAIPFVYTTSDSRVSILATSRGGTVPIETAASSDKRKLLFFSDETGATSFYVRAESVLEFACSAK